MSIARSRPSSCLPFLPAKLHTRPRLFPPAAMRPHHLVGHQKCNTLETTCGAEAAHAAQECKAGRKPVLRATHLERGGPRHNLKPMGSRWDLSGNLDVGLGSQSTRASLMTPAWAWANWCGSRRGCIKRLARAGSCSFQASPLRRSAGERFLSLFNPSHAHLHFFYLRRRFFALPSAPYEISHLTPLFYSHQTIYIDYDAFRKRPTVTHQTADF
jgi:hypothetical protein